MVGYTHLRCVNPWKACTRGLLYSSRVYVCVCLCPSAGANLETGARTDSHHMCMITIRSGLGARVWVTRQQCNCAEGLQLSALHYVCRCLYVLSLSLP